MGHKFKSLFVQARKFFDILPLISVIIDCRAFRKGITIKGYCVNKYSIKE